MKKLLFILRPFIFIAIGVAFAVVSAFFGVQNFTPAQNAVYALQQVTPTPAQDNSVIGSTDGITWVAFAIIFIVIVLPIFFTKHTSKRDQAQR